MIAAVLIPAHGDAPMTDIVALAQAHNRHGLRLYCNGQQFGLFARQPRTGGWMPGAITSAPPCAPIDPPAPEAA